MNYTAQRVLRALEAIVLQPSTAPTVATTLAIHPRTARRILQTLTSEQYVERRGGQGHAAHEYQPTVRLLAMAAQLAPRLPPIAAARTAVKVIENAAPVTAYVAVPCYSDVLIVAATDARAVWTWATLHATGDAAGHVLLAYRDSWRRSLVQDAELAVDDAQAATIVRRGYASLLKASERCGSLAVIVPSPVTPVAALAVRGPSVELARAEQRLIALLRRTAAQVAQEDRPPSTHVDG